MAWVRTLRVLWFGQFLATMATSLGLAIVPFFLTADPLFAVRSEGQRVFYTGLILGGPFVTAIIATPFWGWLGDRSSRKAQVVRATLGLGLTQLLIGFARTPEQIVALRVIQGAVAGVVAANLGFLSATVGAEYQGRALTRLQSANPAAVVCGPLFGSLLATRLGYRPVYIIFGGLVLAYGLVIALLLRDPPQAGRSGPNPFRSLADAIAQAAAHPQLRLAFGVLLLGQLATSTTQVVFAIYAGQVIDAWVAASGATRHYWTTGVGFVALAMVLTGATNFIAAPHWGAARDRGRGRLTPLGALSLAVSNVLMAVWPRYWVVLLARVGIGAGLGGAVTIQYAAIGRHVDVAQRGHYMGLATAVTHVGSLIGFLGCGALARLWGLAPNFLLAASIYGLVAAVSWRGSAAGAPAPLKTS